ncbi:hypothetical protein MY11210_005568 [Beauveria gryllotalpidicola]
MTDAPLQSEDARMPDQGASQSFPSPATADDGVNATIDSFRQQTWTQSGFPIVDGKYIDNGTLKDADPDEAVESGPPALDVYWHNRRLGPEPGLFRGVAAAGFVSVTEYIVKLGGFLAETKGACQIVALNTTLYSVNVIVSTNLSQAEMQRHFLKHGLAPAW